MKKNFLLTLLCFFLHLFYAPAQNVSRSSINSSGGTLTGGGNQITYSIGQTASPTLVSASHVITQGFQQPGEQISTGPLPDTVCAGDSLFIPMNAIDIAAGNIFTAQLSDASGNFASPILIGTASGQALSVLPVLIPAGTMPGNMYRIRVLASSPIVTSPATEVFTAQICIVSVNLKLFIQGFYLGGGQMTPVLYANGLSSDPNACDSILVELHDALDPNTLIASVQTVLFVDGTSFAEFPSTFNGNSYWLSVRHRNSIETWSKNPVILGASTLYDFTAQ